MDKPTEEVRTRAWITRIRLNPPEHNQGLFPYFSYSGLYAERQ